MAPLPAALELRIPPQKELTPTPRVTHLPAPLPRTHTALTLCSRHRAVGRQPGTRQGASPGPLPREKIASTAKTGTLCHKYAFPTTGIVSKLSAPAPRAEASPSPTGPHLLLRPKAGRWVLATGRGQPGRAGRAPALGGSRAGLGAACCSLPGQPWSHLLVLWIPVLLYPWSRFLRSHGECGKQ